MDVADFDFDLPPELVAQEPPPVRGASRLLVLHRDTGLVEHGAFARLGDHLRPGDLLVLNNTKVFPARLLGRRVPSGGAVECLLLREHPAPEAHSREPAPEWEALVHPGQKLKPGARMLFERAGTEVHGEILAPLPGPPRRAALDRRRHRFHGRHRAHRTRAAAAVHQARR